MRKTVLFLTTILLILISCKEEKKTTKKNKIVSREISIIFPDTVYINTRYNGKINYKNDLDTLTTEIHKLQKNTRFLEFTLITTKDINYNDDHLKKIVNDTCIADNNRLIPIYSIQFDKLGVNYIDGIIIDKVMIENGAESKNGKPMDRMIIHETRITKRVIVIDKHQKNEVKYKMKTNDVIFFKNLGIKNKTAKKIFGEGLKDVDNGDYKSARKKFIQADKLESKNVSILNAIAGTEFNLGNRELANKMLLNVILIDSTFAGTYINLSANYMKSRDYEKAKEILLKGKKFTSNKNLHLKSILLINLAVAYNNLGDCENGLKCANETLEISQNEDLTSYANQVKMDSEQICKNK